MKPVLTPEQAVRLDRETQARGVAAADLMERAGWAVARAALDLCGGAYGRRAVVVCGKGDNGGDGSVAARHLARAGMCVTVVPIEEPDRLHEPAAVNFARLAERDIRVRAFTEAGLRRELGRADVAIDAIFGTGFRGMPEDAWADAIACLNASGVPVVAVDIPSGVAGDSGAIDGDAVVAEITVTFGAAKIGVVLLPGAGHAGVVRVVDIGFPHDLLETDTWLTEPSDVATVLPVRAADSHKRASGVLMVVAGSRGMTGAARLMAEAAGRIGTGLVVVAAPASVLPQLQTGIVEATFLPLAETSEGTVSAEAVEAVLEGIGRADALAIGPGLTTNPKTVAFVRALIRRATVPFVLDADGLNAFTGDAVAIAEREADAVLTPHVGEFGRLSGVKPRDLDDGRMAHVSALSRTARAVVLLKGSRTIVAAPGGGLRINPTGSAVLATAGSGDVLTGMIGGLLARGASAFDAAWCGAYIHGLAGTLAGNRFGEGTLAGDVADLIPAAVARVRNA